MLRSASKIAVVIVASLILGLFSAGAQDTAQEETTFFLTFVPNVQFAPVYVALEKGYFGDAGFDLDVEHGDEPIGVDLIAAGQRDFGIISAEQVIAARANERPVVFVYEWFQEFPIGVLVVDSAGIESVEELAGERIGIPGRFGASYSGLIALLNAVGLSEQDIQLEEIGFNAPEVVCVGAIPASVVYTNNEPLQISERVAQGDCGNVDGIRVFPVADYVDLVSNGIITSEALLAEEPERVRAFVQAFDAGLRDAIRNPAETYLLSSRHVENLPLSEPLRAALEQAAEEERQFLAENPEVDRETLKARRDALYERLAAEFDSSELLQLRVLLSTIDLWDADRLGFTDPESWEAMQETLLTMGLIDEPTALDAAYTNVFVPGE